MASSALDLYMGSSIEELEKLAFDVVLKQDVQTLWQIAEDSYIEAIEKDNEGNEEAAYMLYKRHIYVVQKTQTSKEYLLNQDHWDQYFSKENLITSIDRSEFLGASLKQRYVSAGLTDKLKEKLQERSEYKRKESKERRVTPETDNDSFLSYNDSDFDSEDETDSAPVHKVIIVTDLPPVITEDALMLYFERRRHSDGGPVENVDLQSDGSAIVYFEEPEVAARVLKKKDHKIKGKDVHVSVYVPEQPTIKSESTIEVRGFKKLSDDVLEMYFENTRKSGGGDIECVKRNEEADVVLITFESSKVVERVLKKTHQIKNTVLQVSAYQEEPESTEDEFDAACTVEVRDVGALSDDVLEMYFEDTRKSGGGDVTSLTRQDDVIYITFDSGKAATRVLNREHKIKGHRLCVDPLHSKDDQQSEDTKGATESNTVHVEGCKDMSKDLLMMYFENKRRSGGGAIRSLEMNGDDAYIAFENPEDAQRVVERSHKFSGCTLRVTFDGKTEDSSFEQYGELESDSYSSDDAEEESQEMFVLQVAELNQVSMDTLTLYFENRRRSGGGEVDIVEFDEDKNLALVYFKDGEAVKRILQKSPHLLERKTLRLAAYTRSKPQGTRSWLRCLRKAKTVEVKGCQEVGDDKLMLYFENEMRSGGSGIKQVKRSDENRDIVYIIFKDVNVAERVSARTPHTIGRHQLSTTLIKPTPKYDNRFLITEMKDTTTERNLSEYLEKHTPCCPQGFVHGEDNCGVLVTVDTSKAPLCIKDIQKACTRRPLEGAFLDISPVPISNCILVTGLDPDTDADLLSLYFENMKSGNKMQVRVVNVEEKLPGYTLVYFENYKVIEQILPLKHRLGSTNITVSLYMECLQPTTAPFKLPATLKLDDLDVILVRYIRESPGKEADMMAQLRNIHAVLTWSSKCSAEIQCVLSPELPEARKLVKSWEKTARDTFEDFSDQFQVRTEKVLDAVWDKVNPRLDTMERNDCKLYLLPGCTVGVVGPSSDVECLMEDVEHVIRTVEDEEQEENQEITESVKTISPLVVRLLRDSKFSKDITAGNTRVKVSFNKDADQVIFTGPLEDVRRAKEQTQEKAVSIKIQEVGNMSEAQRELVEKEDVRKYILLKLAKKDLVASWVSEKGILKVAALTDADGHAAVHAIKKLVCEQKIALKEESVVLIESKQWTELVDAQVRNKGNSVKIVTDKEKRIVRIYATDEEIVNVTEEINNFINEKTVYSDSVQFRPGIQRFLCEHEIGYIRKLNTVYTKYAVEITESIAKVRFNVRGTKDGLNMIRLELEKLSGKIIHREHEFDKPGITKLLSSDKGDKVIRNVEKAERCIIETDFNPREETKYGKAAALQEDDPEAPETKMTSTIASGRKLIICQGDITELQVDAIVNAANQQLRHIGGLAKVIVDRGGDSIQKECDAIIKSAVEVMVGDVAVTKPGKLPCKWIIHAVGPVWSGGQHDEEELLREAVFRTLEEADQRKMTSVAFPALCTGIFNYPKEAATKVIIEAIKDSFGENLDSMIEEVYVCDKNPDTVNAFIQAVASQNSKDDVPESPKSPKKPPAGGIMMPGAKEVSEASNSFTVGKVRLILKKGDITKEEIDCIVNCTNTDLNMEKGAVSKAISKAGGEELAADIAIKGGDMSKNGIFTTRGGDLPSGYIVHVAVDHFDSEWKNIIKVVLKTVKSIKNVKSIAFPAIGTGSYETSPETIGKLLVEALDEYKGKHHIQELRVVIFQEELVDVFARGVRKAYSKLKDPKSLIDRALDKAKGLMKKKADPTITLHFFSDDTNHIEQAIARLEQHYMDNRLVKEVKDEALKRMNPQQVEEIAKLREAFSVQVEHRDRLGVVRLQGLMNDVLSANDAIHRIIHDVQRYKQVAEKAQMLATYLLWTYIEDSTIMEYDNISNQAIEDAYNNDQKTVELCPAGRDPIVIDFEHMVQYPVSNPAEKLPVVRKNCIKGASFDPPDTWEQMNTDSEMVQVESDSKEYRDVEQKFFDSVGTKRNIIKIRRVQTKFLWQQYVAKKEQLAMQNPSQENEKFLWHGTASDSFPSIAKAGFNRSYCGKNATAYGDGVYFATSASYAVQNAYSKPDKDGHKHIFLARVLTGVYTKGKIGLRVPPTRDESKHLLYDSVVDDAAKPSMYIVFNDTQAYPDYLISFG